LAFSLVAVAVETVFSLYVEDTVLILPQVCLREKLDFAFSLLFSACLGVGYVFFSKRHT
jgi:hypothetical protein